MRILVADDDGVRLLVLKEQLERLGHRVVAEASDGWDAVALARSKLPDLAILDIKMPGLDGIEASRQIMASRPIPVLLVSAYSEAELAERAAEANVSAYLIKPVTEADLTPAILLAQRRFQELEELRQEVHTLEEALEARKEIERAKGILMRRLNLTEEAAYRRMQKQSQDENRKLVEVARAIAMADRLL